MDKPMHITITGGTIVKTILIGVTAYAVWYLRGLVLLVLTAVVIASAIEPGVTFFTRHKVPRVLAVLGMYVAVFGSLFLVVYFFFPPILDDAQSLLSSIPQYLNTLNLPNSFSGSVSGVTNIAQIASAKSSETQSILNSILSFRSAFSDASGGAIRLLAAFFGGIFSLVLVIVLSFYFAIQETGIDDFLKVVTPAKHEEYIVGLWRRAQRKIGLWMQGQLLSSILGAVIAYLGLLILGVPYAFLLAVLTGAAMLVPIFGSFMSAIPAVLVAYSTGSVTLSLIVAGLYLIINQFEAHLIHPLVVNKVVGIPPLLVILALIVGGELAGFLGVVLAIPMAATLREYLNDYSRDKHAAKKIAL